MGKRFSIAEHDLVKAFLIERDGDCCVITLAEDTEADPLEIDHADGNPENWAPENLHLIVRSWNKKLRALTSWEHKQFIKDCCAKSESARARRRGNMATFQVRQKVDFSQGSAEMKANNYYELKYRDWVLDIIKREGFITVEESEDDGAEYIGGSQITIKRYNKKLCGKRNGILQVRQDRFKTKVLVFKDKYKPPAPVDPPARLKKIQERAPKPPAEQKGDDAK